jgi:hypothetical protein
MYAVNVFKLEISMKKVLISMGALFFFGAHADGATNVSEESYGLFDGFFAGAGLGVDIANVKVMEFQKDQKVSADHALQAFKSTRLIAPVASLSFGYNFSSGIFLFGPEGMLHFNAAKTKKPLHENGGGDAHFEVKSNVFSPYIGVRFGLTFPSNRIAVYAKLGALRTSVSLKGDDYIFTYSKSINMSKVVPVISLGVEKFISGNTSVRLEADAYGAPVLEKKVYGTNELLTKVKRRGFAFRALAIYNVK